MAAKKDKGSWTCSGSVTGHSSGKDGMCAWGCGTRIEGPVAKPRIRGKTDMDQEYRRHYDPDYGSGKDDV